MFEDTALMTQGVKLYTRDRLNTHICESFRHDKHVRCDIRKQHQHQSMDDCFQLIENIADSISAQILKLPPAERETKFNQLIEQHKGEITCKIQPELWQYWHQIDAAHR